MKRLITKKMVYYSIITIVNMIVNIHNIILFGKMNFAALIIFKEEKIRNKRKFFVF